MTNIKTKIITILSTVTLVSSLGIFAGCSTGAGNVSAGNEGITNQQVSGNLPYASKEEALKALDQIQITDADNSNYDRTNDWGDWKYVSSEKHNTRFEVLKTQGTNIKVEGNKIVGGSWLIKYTGELLTFDNASSISSGLQIDHIVSVHYTNNHNGKNWDADKKKEFYNDYGQATLFTVGNNETNNYEKHSNLIVSDSRSNTQKSDKGPSAWMPSNKAYHLEYAEKWVDICSYYGISITQADYNTLKNAINNG